MADDANYVFEPSAQIRRLVVRSSNVESIGHDPETGVLEVEYRGGVIYRYAGVDQRVAEGVTGAPSVGAAVAQTVRGRYPHQIVRRPDADLAGAADDSDPPKPKPFVRPRSKVGPKPPPMEARIDDYDPEMDAIRRPEERLADGTVRRGGSPCSACGLPLFADSDPERARAGVQRCQGGHVEMSAAVNASRLDVGRW